MGVLRYFGGSGGGFLFRDQFEDLGKGEAEDDESDKNDVSGLEGGLVGRDAGKAVGLVVEVTHLRLEDAVETDIGHKDRDDGHIGHAPFPGLEGEIVDEFVLCPFALAQQGDAGGQQFCYGEEDAESEDEHADKDGVEFARRYQDTHDVDDAFALKEDHLVPEGDRFAQQGETQRIDPGVDVDHGSG